MFSTFNTFSSLSRTLNLIPLPVNTVVNGNFLSPQESGVNTYIFGVGTNPPSSTTTNTAILPGWTMTLNNINILISKSGSNFYPSSGSGNFNQTLTVQSYNLNSVGNIYQTVNLTLGTRTISFYASGRDGCYNIGNIFSVTLGGTSLVSNQSVSTKQWDLYSYTFNAPTTGLYNLSFNFSNSNNTGIADSSINLSNITIV